MIFSYNINENFKRFAKKTGNLTVELKPNLEINGETQAGIEKIIKFYQINFQVHVISTKIASLSCYNSKCLNFMQVCKQVKMANANFKKKNNYKQVILLDHKQWNTF